MKLRKPGGSAAIIAAFLVLAVLPQTGSADQSAQEKQALAAKQKVIFQVSDNDPQKWNLALNNAKNVQQDLGRGNVNIEIVAYGPGIGMLKLDSPVATRVDEARQSGVEIVACENTMKAQKITRDDMLPAIAYVSAGVIELMQKQQQGYAYIRP